MGVTFSYRKGVGRSVAVLMFLMENRFTVKGKDDQSGGKVQLACFAEASEGFSSSVRRPA